MPRKTKKRFPLKTRRRRFKRKSNGGRSMIVYKPVGTGFALPQRFRTAFVLDSYFILASGSASLQFPIPMNWMYKPFQLSTGLGSITFPGLDRTTYCPPGIPVLINKTMYQTYRVYSSSIVLECIPQSVSDAINVSVSISDNVTYPQTYQQSLTVPYFKTSSFGSSKTTITGDCLKLSMSVAKYLGCSKSAVESDLSGALDQNWDDASDPNAPLFWMICANTVDNTTLSSNVGFRIKIKYYVEMFNLTQAQQVTSYPS